LAALRGDALDVLRDLRAIDDGQVYQGPAANSSPDDFAIAVALIDGRRFAVGDAGAVFPIMSVSKPFTYALALEQHGVADMIDRIGVSATGLPYNSVAAGAVRKSTEQNPMVNPGAIATHAFIEGATPGAKLESVVALYSQMASRPLQVRQDWIRRPKALTFTLAYQMQAAGRLPGDIGDVTARYFASNVVAVSIEDLAQMGATLANGGVQPITAQRVITQDTSRTVLSAMTVAGMYEASGRWWTEVGLPAKSGVSGGIVAIAPGWGAIAAFSPKLDAQGNSVRGALAIHQLAERWGLHGTHRLLKSARPVEKRAP
jgi:glutaminase